MNTEIPVLGMNDRRHQSRRDVSRSRPFQTSPVRIRSQLVRTSPLRSREPLRRSCIDRAWRRTSAGGRVGVQRQPRASARTGATTPKTTKTRKDFKDHKDRRDNKDWPNAMIRVACLQSRPCRPYSLCRPCRLVYLAHCLPSTSHSPLRFGISPNISGEYRASTLVGGRLNSPTLFKRTVYSTTHFPFGTNS